MKRSPKLLYFVTEDWYFCSHRLSLAVAAKEAGFDVAVVTRARDHAEKIRRSGLRLIPFELSRGGMNPFREWEVVKRLISVYRLERPDLVHHVAVKPVIYGSIAARLSGVHIVVNALAGLGWLFTSTCLKARLLKPVVKLIFRALLSPTPVIVQNPDDAALFERIGLSSVHLIRGSGVDTAVFYPTRETEGEPLIVLPARLLWGKGVGEFVEAARRLKTHGVKARFALVGAPDKGNPAAVPEEHLARWREEGVVECWGSREDMPDVYAQSHVVCLPSYREGLPKALLEAASCGRPIVAADVPGCREIVRHGENGILVPGRDSDALASALRILIEDPSLRARMGTRGREIAVAEFSAEKVTQETLSVYRELLGRK